MCEDGETREDKNKDKLSNEDAEEQDRMNEDGNLRQ